MALAPEAVRVGLPAAVPMVATLALEFVEIEEGRAVMRLPDEPQYRNHVGGPHAGAMFTLGESASGAVVLQAFGDLLERVTPLPTHAAMDFLAIATGPMTATATMQRSALDVLAELDGGSRPVFDVEVVLTTEDGTRTGTLTVTWTLRLNR